MEHPEMYELSLRLNQALQRAKNLMDTDAFRYAHLVNNSPRGSDCTYAKICLREHNHDHELLTKTLDDLYEVVVESRKLLGA